jgi:hypothetical protein
MMNALFVAWRPPAQHEGWRPVGRLEHEDGVYRFFYTEGARKPGFRPFDRMEQLDQIYESIDLFPVFANRLLSSSRPEYESFLTWGGFDIADPPDPIVVLGLTEGVRQTDAIEVFPCPRQDQDGCYFNKFFLHGIRYFGDAALSRIDALKEGEELLLMPDPQNAYDQRAVALRTEDDRILIGYIPRYLARDAHRLIWTCDYISVRVSRVNLDAPLQNRVLCQMNACWPDDFTPCSGEDFAPIPAHVTSRCE